MPHATAVPQPAEILGAALLVPEVVGAGARPAPAASLRRLSSRALLAEGKEVEIDHDGVIYRLRITALGKLILTK